jgi:hypothetical protein
MGHALAKKETEKLGRWNIVGPYELLQTKKEMCAKFS